MLTVDPVKTDLAMLVARLALALRAYDVNHALAATATEYLKTNKLDQPASGEAPTGPVLFGQQRPAPVQSAPAQSPAPGPGPAPGPVAAPAPSPVPAPSPAPAPVPIPPMLSPMPAPVVPLTDAEKHERWCAKLIADGWGYGRAYSDTDRTDPRLQAFELLSPEMQERARRAWFIDGWKA